MNTILLIVLGVYVFIALGFFAAMVVESRKQEANITGLNVLVAAIWPFWMVWYSYVTIEDWFRRK